MKITPNLISVSGSLTANRLAAFFITPVFLLLFHQNLLSQCTLTCQSIQISLDEDCEVEVTWDQLLTGNVPVACQSQLKVQVLDAAGNLIPTSPFVTGANINQTLTGKVIHSPTGNSCWGVITVEDKLKPVITCKDTLISCFHSTAPATTGFPIAIDNCTDTVSLSFTSAETTFDCMVTDTIRIINRLWTATDSSGNSATCLQKIYVERPELDDLDFPRNFDNVQEPALACTDPNTAISICGEPSYAGFPVDSVCSFLANHVDVSVPVCEGSQSVFREWIVYDGCKAEYLKQEQIINILDTLPPDLTCPADITVNTSNLDCTATVLLPQPTVYDSCCASISIEVEGAYGTITGNTIYNLPAGVYPSTCFATDDCGNVSTCLFQITVKDNVPPVAVSFSQPNISLLPTQPTYVNAATFDNGSWDNCSTITRSVRRLDSPSCPGNDSTPFGNVVPFFCCDAGKTVTIELRVTDAAGNSSTVTSVAQVYDNLNPGIVCPPNKTIDCSQDYNDLNLTGQPTATDNCPGYTVTHFQTAAINSCGQGNVQRTWKVEDHVGRTASCLQTITVDNLDPFFINNANPNDPNDDVVWPQNYITTTCSAGLEPGNLPPANGFPQITSNAACDLISISHTDTWLSQPQNGCIEILRTWLVIDWCQYNPVTFAGSWQFGQILRVTNSLPPVFTSTCEELDFCSFDESCLTGIATISVAAEDDCNGPAQLKFTYKIDLLDDGSVNLNGTGASVTGQFPLGTHRITYTVEDGCQNKTNCSFLFTIRDCKAPTPVCEDLTVQISNGTSPDVEVFASSFDAGSNDNCTSPANLTFSFSSNTSEVMRPYDCFDAGTNEVKIYVTDEAGNQAFCVVELEVQTNANGCDTHASIAGSVLTETGAEVAKVLVQINDPAMLDSMTTGNDGAFLFSNLVLGGDFTITPHKDVKPLNGVTTFDLVLITRHILGITLLDSPYKIIAADVNKSGGITTFDLVLLRKLILVIDPTFTQNDSWRFVDASFDFPNPANPFATLFPEIISINNLPEDETVQFIAIKIGDVNGSVNAKE